MGKDIPGSERSFEELKAFTDTYYSGDAPKEMVIKQGYKLLDTCGIKLRQDDGHDPKMTISIPHKGRAIVIGLRYVKKDGRKTEDHFLLRPNARLYRCQGKELDKLLPEYKGAHIYQA